MKGQLSGPLHKRKVDELQSINTTRYWIVDYRLRFGGTPAIGTTTPRPLPIIKALLEDSMYGGHQRAPLANKPI
jgi:hypothetical protein